MSAIRFLPQLRSIALAVLVGLTMAAIGLLAAHYGMKAAYTAAENRELKNEVRDLVIRLAEVEEVLQDVGHERKEIDELTLATLGAVIDTAAIDSEEHGRVYQALRGHQDDDKALVRRLRMGPPAAAATYAALVERMTSLRDQAHQLVGTLQMTSKDLAHRQEILAAIPSRLPAQGWLSSDFGRRNSPFHGNESMHYGLDIAADEGTPIYAPADGTVTYASAYGSYGKLVKLDHDFGISTRFAHNAQILVKKGQHVHRGDAIAVVGSSGRSTGPHVHYEILLHGKPVDPARFVLEKPRHLPLADTLQAPKILAATPHGTGGDADNSDAQGAMALALDSSYEALEHQHGLLPWTTGERLLTLQSLPRPLQLLTTTDLYLTIPMLLLLTLVLVLARPPERALRRLLMHPAAAAASGWMGASLPFGLSWTGGERDHDDGYGEDDDLED